MRLHTVSAFKNLPPEVRNALSVPNAHPFFNTEFLQFLESSGCVSEKTGWRPCHLWVEQGGKPVFLLPLYEKSHSWGEFVFDQRWAQAYQQHGLSYYPKWVTSIPYTPSVGPRWWSAEGEDEARLLDFVLDNIARQLGAPISSWHLLFADRLPAGLKPRELLQRRDTQFHWRNHGYHSFDDFLAQLKSRKRKNVRRERARVAEQGIELVIKEGTELGQQDWARFFRCYANTYRVRGQEPYLNLAFFEGIGAARPHQIMQVQAHRAGEIVGMALCFHDQHTLYGRHWGALAEFDCLHFEACFYQGIDYCIRKGLQQFDPGTQGEHKLLRGFEPVQTESWHWIGHPAFRDAIARFLEWETAESQRYYEAAGEWLPFKAAAE